MPIVTSTGTSGKRITFSKKETMTCIRCNERQAPEPLGLCAPCVMHTRLEVASGLRRLGLYLTAWAAFDDWLRAHGRGGALA